ncbi:HTTM domain-containing protein [Bizionia argentinensis JUB59]|uniref:HTTM domain-containing protein n=1 Tax=Bizionia argentinensis JUB59 TaxID=1046627 RepID=G2EAW9_9FLAO|nr:HTTM domain-containing protein [Bizionia argentinensis]EGV44249.1 HTTM domain-containing protein [Bizionia argentinensis JUB59]
MNFKIKTYLAKQTSAAPLVVFRMLFGIMMFYSIVRFWAHGWIDKLYIQPDFHFSFYGFHWVKPLGTYTYLVFVVCGLAALFVAIGYKYRIAIITFFLSFAYIELMDKTTYLNHYYFISVLSFLMIFLPANVSFSVESYLKKVSYAKVPNWTIDSIKLLLGLVYFYAGLAKINSDWLFKAMPLKIWLPSKYDLPIIGETLMQQEWFHYAMSWSGMFYDLLIPFLLLYKRTRLFAFIIVIFFHVFTRVLFPIGMFPFIMIVSTLIFFEANFHQKIINFVIGNLKFLRQKIAISNAIQIKVEDQYPIRNKRILMPVLMVFFAIQMVFPFRYFAYPGELFWTEEGFRFSWRVMLMEKMGYTTFTIKNAETGAMFVVDNSDFLTEFQEKQMSFQPDFILEYAHYLGDHFAEQGHENIQVFAESYVAINGRLSQPYINSNVDLYKENDSFKHKTWILPFNDVIKGL